MALTVFTAYSHRDEEIRNALASHLAPLVRDGMIDVWYDRLIPAGASLDDTIDERVEAADVILLLVSSDFVASDYCWSKEAKRALERRAEGRAAVIPVIARYCDWQQSPLGALRASPTDGLPIVGGWADQDFAMLTVARDVRAVAEQLLKARENDKQESDQRHSFTPVDGTEDYSPNGLAALRLNHLVRYNAALPESIELFVSDYAFEGISFLVTAAVTDSEGKFRPSAEITLEASGGDFGYANAGLTGETAGGVFSTKIYPHSGAGSAVISAHSPGYGSVQHLVRIVKPPAFGG